MVKETLVRVVMQLYDGAKTKVKVSSVTSEAFDVKVGFHCSPGVSVITVSVWDSDGCSVW